ncbi:hypothetical protein D3C85_1683030 [compost metagenome]
MKTNKQKKNKKFDLEKMKVAKLRNLRAINGGDSPDDDIKTITDIISAGNVRTK